MQRQTPMDTSFRAYVGGGARGVVHEADDKKMVQEVKVNFLKGETRDKVERMHDYGFTGYVRKAEYKDNQIERSAEHFTQFIGGNRSFPAIAKLDDRRYRLRNFVEGEVAIYDDQQQKVHLQRDRVYTRSQYKVEMRVINDQPKMEGHGKDKEADRDQQKDKSRRWSTYVMDKDTITIERTDIDDAGEKEAKTQDEPEKHITMLSRVFLDKDHVHVLTPHISILWDEDKRKLVLNTEKTSISMEDREDDKEKPHIIINAGGNEPYVTVRTSERSITIDDKDKSIIITGTSTAIKVDDNIGRTRVGTTAANIPAAHLLSLVSSGDYICGNVAKKVLVI